MQTTRTLFHKGICCLATLAWLIIHTSYAHSASANSAVSSNASSVLLSSNATPTAALTFPIDVEHRGADHLGATLAQEVRARLAAEPQFALTIKDMPKIRVIITSIPEFPSRPAVGSAFAAVWIFYERPTMFTSFLDTKAGVVSTESVASTADQLVTHTATLAAQFAYLFE